MKKSLLFASGALPVVLIQLMISTILVAFLDKVLVNSDDPELMLVIILRVSPDRYSFELIQELLQFSLFLPVMLFISVKLIRCIDVECSYLMIRHQFKTAWSLKTYLNTLMLCCEAALTSIITLTVYIKIFMDRTLVIHWFSFVALTVSITLGLIFYITLTTLITLNRPVIILMLTLVILLSIGKILVHSIPEIARLTVASAIYLNHLFEPVSEPRLILSDIGKIFEIIVMDLVVISFLSILFHNRINKMDFIGRRL